MERRGFLATGAAVATTAVAGCTGDVAGGPSGSGDDPADTRDRDGNVSITGTEFERTGDASEPGDRARVAFGGNTVTCTGVIQGRNGCMRAALGDATYDESADELRVRVTTVSDGGDNCTQQIVNRGYEASVTFEGGLPGRVVVDHESMGDVRTVVRATR